MTNTKATVVHLATLSPRNDSIACEGWYYPRTHEHTTTGNYGAVTCPTCISEVMALADQHDAAAIVERINTRYDDANLTVSDLVRIDGVWTIDGMDPDEWAEAMYGADESDYASA